MTSKGAAWSGTPRKEDIAEALTLLRHVSRQGVPVNDMILSSVLAASGHHEEGTWSPEKERSFWKALSALAKAAAPADVQSIRAQERDSGVTVKKYLLFGRRIDVSLAERVAHIYKGVAIMLILAILGLQVLWVGGASLLGTIQALSVVEEGYDIALAGLYNWVKWPDLFSICEAGELSFVPGEMPNQICSFWLLKATLEGIELFFLPVFYGMLGACTYVLRRLSQTIGRARFTSTTPIRYQLRFLLGAVAGLSAAWFINLDGQLPIHLMQPVQAPYPPGGAGESGNVLSLMSSGGDDFLSAVKAWAVAFIAGYSVEILFSGMDKVVSSFTDQGAVAEADAPEGRRAVSFDGRRKAIRWTVNRSP